MRRLFDEHKIRKVIDLGGAWKFSLDPDKKGINEDWQNGLPCGETVIVPSVWNNELGILNFEGCCWYEKKFLTEGGTLLLEFESVMSKATVWLDGNKLGEHYGAFTAFEFIANDVACGEHTLVVCADNRFDQWSFPRRYTDWFNYGGIARDVFAHELKGICVLNCHIKYELNENLTSATISSSLELYNASCERLTSPVCVGQGVVENVCGTGADVIATKAL